MGTSVSPWYQAQVVLGKRDRKKTTMEIDGHTVLKVGAYTRPLCSST